MSDKPESKRVRELRGLTSLKDFSKPLGVTISNISNIENGGGLSSELAKKICDVHNVSMDWLFGRTDERNIYSAPTKVEEPQAEYVPKSELIDVQRKYIELLEKQLNKSETRQATIEK